MEVKEIAKRLKQARVQAGYKTARSFIENFGISQSTYSLHETGQRSIGSRSAITYCKLLGIDLDWLLTGESVSSDDGKPEISSALSLDQVVDTQDNFSHSQRLSDEDLQQMTLVTQTKHSDMKLKTIDHELLSEITREVMQIFNEDTEKADEIARAVSVIYYNIEETTGDKSGKHLLIKPLINAFKVAFEKPSEPSPELKVSNLS